MSRFFSKERSKSGIADPWSGKITVISEFLVGFFIKIMKLQANGPGRRQSGKSRSHWRPKPRRSTPAATSAPLSRTKKRCDRAIRAPAPSRGFHGHVHASRRAWACLDPVSILRIQRCFDRWGICATGAPQRFLWPTGSLRFAGGWRRPDWAEMWQNARLASESEYRCPARPLC